MESVTSCRSNRVRPQEGHDTNSATKPHIAHSAHSCADPLNTAQACMPEACHFAKKGQRQEASPTSYWAMDTSTKLHFAMIVQADTHVTLEYRLKLTTHLIYISIRFVWHVRQQARQVRPSKIQPRKISSQCERFTCLCVAHARPLQNAKAHVAQEANVLSGASNSNAIS